MADQNHNQYSITQPIRPAPAAISDRERLEELLDLLASLPFAATVEGQEMITAYETTLSELDELRTDLEERAENTQRLMDLIGDGEEQYQIDARITLTTLMYSLEAESMDLEDAYIETRDQIEEFLTAANRNGNA